MILCQLLIIGTSQRPRGFPADRESLPVDYANSKKGWMTSSIWMEYLRKWDRELRLKNRKILLLADNAPSHPFVPRLTNIKLDFLPKNTTSLIQPCDAGVIKCFKGFYRSALTNRILGQTDNFENNCSDQKCS